MASWLRQQAAFPTPCQGRSSFAASASAAQPQRGLAPPTKRADRRLRAALDWRQAEAAPLRAGVAVMALRADAARLGG